MSDTLQTLITSTKKRADMGKAKYGVYLTAANGRNPIVDAFQEALDQIVYLRQAIEDADAMPPVHPDYATRPEPAPMNQPDLTPIYALVIADLQEMDDLQICPWCFTSDLHYIYYSAIQLSLHLQRTINARLTATTEA